MNIEEVKKFINTSDEEVVLKIKKECQARLKVFEDAKPTIYDNFREEAKKYPGVRFVYLGHAFKGGWECAGEIDYENYLDKFYVDPEAIERIYSYKEYKPITRGYKTLADFENSILQNVVSTDRMKELCNAKREFRITLNDGYQLHDGEICYYLYDIKNDNIFSNPVQVAY